MAEPICEDDGVMQEWTPLTQLLQQIPLKTQRGLFSKNLNLTCLDVVTEFIALGTNLGFIYWYCRPTGDLQRLHLENYNCCVTCVKIMLFVDYMIAAGTNQGTVIIFQIPKIQYESPIDQAKFKRKKMERFTVNGLHKSSVTSIEWNPNEMKVFSGDKSGGVVLTEIDLSLHISKSMELLNEQFEIVQLSYCQNILLISTVYRSIICDGSNNWKVHQVGRKERKILGKFGAALCKFPHGLVLFASRPGHRLWLSDKTGIVQQTLIFKSAVQYSCPKIQLMNPVDKKEPYDTSFGKLIQFGDNKLITYNSEIMYVLHPGAVTVISVLNGARRILDLAVNDNEIFILEGERSLLRVGILPDKYSFDMLYQPVSRRTSFNLDELAAKLKDTAVESIKKITKDLIPADEESPNSPPALADEALELPPVIALPSGLMPTLSTAEDIKNHSSVFNQNSIASTNFSLHKSDGNSPFSASDQDLHEEIIIRSARKRNNKKAKGLPSLKGNVLASESGSDTASNLSEDRLVCGVANDQSLSDESAFSESQSSFSMLRDISSLLSPQKAVSRNFEARSEEMMKTSDTKSQTSLDTCESVSERLLLPVEPFREERKKSFVLLPEHSLFDSYNSEKTDNMSISLNITTSSSVSSKISENLPSPSYASENSEMAFRVKSAESQSTDNFEGELQSSSKEIWWKSSDFKNRERSFEGSSDSSGSNRKSQKELDSKWPGETEGGCAGILAEPQIDQSKAFDKGTDASNKSCSHIPDSDENIVVNSLENDLLESGQGPKIQDTADFNSYPKHLNNLQHQNTLKSEELERKDRQKDDDEEKKANEFWSNDSINYGPPSGSSMLSSLPSSDFTTNTSGQHILQPLAQDSFDHWPQYKTPRKITSLAASKNYVICTDHKRNVYYSHLTGLGLCWRKLDHKASMVRVSSDGSAVWLLNNKTVSALITPSLNSPISDSVEDFAQDIRTIAIDSINKEGLMVTVTGKIITYTNMFQGMQDEIPCDHIIADVACSGGVILALSTDCSVLCKLPEEDSFRLVKTVKPTSSLALGPENLLWVVDEVNNIFFSDDYLNENPHWWQIQISDYIFQNLSGSFQNTVHKMKLNELKASIQLKNTLVATNDSSIWIYNKFDSTVYVNKTGFTGYMWNMLPSVKALPNIQWQTLCAGGVVGDKGHIWLLSVDGNIFWFNPKDQHFQSIPIPCEENIVCITSSVETLWVLSENGGIYSRLGLSSGKESGISWKQIKPLQIDNLRFVWISCGTDVAWACDIHGRTFMSTRSPQHMATLNPTWIEVEGRPKDVQFEKVFVGTQLHMVWAVDTNRNLYVREGIFPHYQIGTSWVYVCGIEASQVTISGMHVWALTPNGNIYRRCGVSESNFTGDYWRSIPGNLKVISSSCTDKLWGIGQENKILQLNYKLKILREPKTSSEQREGSGLKEDTSWEIVK